MSLAKPKVAEASAEVKKDDAPKAEDAKNDAQAAPSAPMKKYDLGRKLGSFKRKLNAYTRVKARALAALQGEKEEKAADSSDAKAAEGEPEKKPVSKVLECYRLVRNFCLTYNWVQLDFPSRKESMLSIPEAFEDDFKKLLSEEVVTKFLAAMKGPVQDVVSNLPAEFDDALVKKIIAFIDEKDKDTIIEKLKKDTESLAAEFEVLKVAKKASEPKSAASKKKEAPKKNVISSKDENSKSKNGQFCAETMFKDMIAQIKKRISSIRFLKDDFQVFSEVQGQIDLLLFDANSELHQIKKSIKKKFENAQKNAERNRPRRNIRRMRRPGRRNSDEQRRSNDRRNGQSNSVFSKGHQIHDEEFE